MGRAWSRAQRRLAAAPQAFAWISLHLIHPHGAMTERKVSRWHQACRCNTKRQTTPWSWLSLPSMRTSKTLLLRQTRPMRLNGCRRRRPGCLLAHQQQMHHNEETLILVDIIRYVRSSCSSLLEYCLAPRDSTARYTCYLSVYTL